MKITKEFIQHICFDEIISQWDAQSGLISHNMFEITSEQKKENEAFLSSYFMRMQKGFSEFPQDIENQQQWKQETEAMLKEFVKEEKVLGIWEDMGSQLYNEFDYETKSFMRMARQFDAELSMEDIWQALRNYIVYAVIVNLQGERQECGHPILSYSLLYPYTDNFIDNKKFTKREKENYNMSIKKTIIEESGRKREEQGATEETKTDEQNAFNNQSFTQNELKEKTCTLLRQLFSACKEEKRRELSDVLLLMLKAQNDSILQQKHCNLSKADTLTKESILKISAYKGGISVLIDYILSTQEVTKEESVFYLKLGFFLQLADDLQDIQEDVKSGSYTIMTMAVKEKKLEYEINRLMNFIYSIMEEFTPRNSQLKEFVFRNCITMILFTVVTIQKYVSVSYLKQIERYLPVSLTFIKQLSKKQSNVSGFYGMTKEMQMKVLDVFTAV